MRTSSGYARRTIAIARRPSALIRSVFGCRSDIGIVVEVVVETDGCVIQCEARPAAHKSATRAAE
jgi:hypothetical protein